jgi:hypothetical protein
VAHRKGFTEHFGHEDALAERVAIVGDGADIQAGAGRGFTGVLDSSGGGVGVVLRKGGADGHGGGGNGRLGETRRGAAVDVGAGGTCCGGPWRKLALLLGTCRDRAGERTRGRARRLGSGGPWEWNAVGDFGLRHRLGTPPTGGGGAAALLFSCQIFDGYSAGEDVAGELAGVIGKLGHGAPARDATRDSLRLVGLIFAGGSAEGFAHGGVGLHVLHAVVVHDAEMAGAERFGDGEGDLGFGLDDIRAV